MTAIDDQLSALLEDPNFRKIQGRMGRFNLFEAIGAVNGELRHSNFLSENGRVWSLTVAHAAAKIRRTFIAARETPQHPGQSDPDHRHS